jgi:cell division septation protein DedD
MTSGDLAQAKAELQEIVQDSPGTWMADFAAADLAHGTMATLEAAPKTESHEREARYAVQVGAFSARENAREEEKKFFKVGYKTEVRERQEGRKKSYLVWVGEFHDRDQARDFADELQKKFKTRYHVVRRDD